MMLDIEKVTILGVIIWVVVIIVNAYFMRKTYLDGKKVGYRKGFEFGYRKGYDDAEHRKIANMKQYVEWFNFFYS